MRVTSWGVIWVQLRAWKYTGGGPARPTLVIIYITIVTIFMTMTYTITFTITMIKTACELGSGPSWAHAVAITCLEAGRL